MADVAMYTIKHMKRLCISHVSNKVKSDFFWILVLDYSKAKGNLIAFYLEPITVRLLELNDDEEFNEDNFLTYHLSMPNPQSSPLSKLIEQGTPLASNLSEVRMKLRSRQLQRINVGSSKKSIPQKTSCHDEGVHSELVGTDVMKSPKIAPVNLGKKIAAEEESEKNWIVPVAPGPVMKVFTSPQ